MPIRNEKRCTPFLIANENEKGEKRCTPFLIANRHLIANENEKGEKRCTPFLIANRHLFTSDRQIALVSSAGIPFRQRSPHIDIVHLYKARGIENRHSAPC